MTTFSDLIEETRHQLMTGQPDRLNVLDLSINDSTDTVQFRYDLLGIAPNSRICIGLEEMHVLSVSGTAAASTAVVIRGFAGSTPAAHTAGDKIYVNAQFTDWRISKYVNQALQDLSARGLFQIKAVEFQYVPSTVGFTLTAPDLIDIWRVNYDRPGPWRDWPEIPKDLWDINNAANTTDFVGGKQLTLHGGGFPGHNVRVTYKAGFATLTTLPDDVLAVAGLHVEAHDLPPLLAALDLLAGRDIKRSFLNRQPEPRRQQEVPPGAAQAAMDSLVKLIFGPQGRIAVETQRLKRRYPGAA